MRTALPTLSASEYMDTVPAEIDGIEEISQRAPAPAYALVERRVARIHRMLAWVLLGGVTLQIFFAGMGVFGVSSFLPHAILGAVVILASFSLPIVAWRGHLEAAIVRRSWLLAGLMVLQGLLIDAGRFVHVVSAFHPVNAMLLVLVTYSLTRRHA